MGMPLEPIRVRILRGSYYTLLGTSAGVLGNFAVSVILARLLGSGALGVFTIYTVLGTVLIPLFGLSIPSAVTKYVAERSQGEREVLARKLSAALLILLVSGTVGTVFLLGFVAPLAGQVYGEGVLVPMLTIMGLAVLANLLALFAGAILQGLEDFQTTNLLGAISVLATVLSLLVLVPILGLFGAAIAGAISVVVHAALALFAVARVLPSQGITLRWEFSWSDARALLTFVAPLNVAGMISRAGSLIQNSLVAIYLGFVDLGYLRVAGVFFSAVLFLPRMLLAPLLPILTSMTGSRIQEQRAINLTRLVKLSTLLVIPFASALILCLPVVIELFYGTEFLPSVPFAIVTILVGVLIFPNTILGEQYPVATGRTFATLWITGYSVGVSLLLVLAFLPIIGAMALPAAALVAESTSFAILLGWLARRHELIPSMLAAPIGLLAASSGAAILGVLSLDPGLALLAALPVAVLLYLGEFYGVMKGEERSMVTTAIRGALRSLGVRGG